MKILIFGANGFVGRRTLKRLTVSGKHEILACSRNADICFEDGYTFQQFDLYNTEDIPAILVAFCPDVVINAAALSAVDYCEQHRKEAETLNYTAVKYMAEWCGENRRRLIHLSTDFVFDGHKSSPYVETDPTKAVNFYGTTKILGENAVQTFCKDYAILRIEVVYGKPLNGQHGNIIQLIKERLEQHCHFKAAADQWRTPTWVEDVAKAIVYFVESSQCGIFHIAGGEILSIFELAQRVGRFFGLDTSLIEPIETQAMNESTPRPRYTPMNCSKARKICGYQPTPLEIALTEWE